MRSFLLAILAVGIIGLGFAAYWIMQGEGGIAVDRDPQRQRADRPTTLPTSNPHTVGPGQDVWVERYDKETGQRTSRLRARRYEPMKDGRVQVFEPEVEFFLHNGQVLRIRGQRGLVTMEEGLQKSDIAGNVNQTPRGGDLFDVTLDVLASTTNRKVTLTMTMHNASFDNETFRIQTESYTENGKTIPADQVKVIVRGEDYEFDGRGLSLQYNELDRRLEYLRIAHGQRLKILKPGRFMPSSGENKPPIANLPSPMSDWERLRLVPPLDDVLLVAADRGEAAADAARDRRRPARENRDARQQRRATPRPAPATRISLPRTLEPVVYRATFKHEVEIWQSGKVLARSEDLQVDWMDEEDELLPTGQTRPATRSTTRPRSRQRDRSTAATQATHEPIEIRWNGPLEVVPLAARPPRIDAGESIVKLIGNASRPAFLSREVDGVGSTLTAGSLTHWTIDSGILLEEAPNVLVEINDTRGTRIVTHRMEGSGDQGRAILTGKSSVRYLVEATAGEKPETLDMDWNDEGILYFSGDNLDQMTPSRFDARGAVRAVHPQGQLAAEAMQVHLIEEPKTIATTRKSKSGSSQIKQIDAQKNVAVVFPGEAPGQDQKLWGDDLKVLMDRGRAGQMYVRQVNATGNVRGELPELDIKEIRGDSLVAALKEPAPQPTTRPATRSATRPAGMMAFGEMELVTVLGHVHVLTTKGETAEANELSLQGKAGQPIVTLLGQPARVSSGANTITGGHLVYSGETEVLSVPGAGTLHGILEPKDAAARPMRLDWSQFMSMDLKANKADAVGDVVFSRTEDDGAETVGKGRRAHMVLATQPSTQPTTQPALAAQSTTKPANRGLLGQDLFKDRVVKSVAMQDDAMVESILWDAAGQRMLRMFHVDSQSINYDNIAKTLTIPQAGKLLFFDDRPPSTQPAAQEAAKDPMGVRGETGFAWKDSLVYDGVANKITMRGEVAIARRAQQKPSTRPATQPTTQATTQATTQPAIQPIEPMTLQADLVVADLVETPAPATKPATNPALAASQPATRPAGMFAVKMQLKTVHAEGDIWIKHGKLNARAHSLDYDPVNHLLTVRGTDREHATMLDEHELPSATFKSIVWNTETGNIIKSEELVARSRK